MLFHSETKGLNEEPEVLFTIEYLVALPVRLYTSFGLYIACTVVGKGDRWTKSETTATEFKGQT